MASSAKVGHPVLDVAQFVLAHCYASGINDSITPMQLIKLVYLCHAWVLGLLGRPLIHEAVEAWEYGPVVPKLYQAIKHHKSSVVPTVPGAKSADLKEDERSIVQQVCSIYGPWDGISLSRLTHRAGSPWDLTWRGSGRSAPISNDIIEHHYAALAKAGS